MLLRDAGRREMEPGQAAGFDVAKFAALQVKAAAGIFRGFAGNARLLNSARKP
jgi:hypothetical protein